jgi:large repetitive protein
MALSMRILNVLLASSAVALAGCTSLLGDFTYDANPRGSGGSGGGFTAEQQGDIVVQPTAGLVTTEQGLKAHFSIVLKRQPMAPVAIALSSSNNKEGTVSPSVVSFTPENYDAPQVVQITGVDDDLPDGSQKYTIKTSPATSDDKTYHGIDPVDPEVRNVDDETAGFLLMPPGGLVTTESGGEATFTLALTHAPTADVTIPLSSDKPTEGTVSPMSLTFTPVNWMAPQIVTVTGINDDAADGPQTFHVVTSPASSMDQGYDKLDPDDETVTNQDNDSAGVTLSPEVGLVTFENGATTTFSIVLNSPPSKDVSIALSSSDEAEGTVSPARVTFTSLNWMAPQVVEVTGVDDTRADGNQPYSIITAPCESDDAGYATVNGPDAQLINVDDDTPGLVVTPTLGLVTREDGAMATFTVALQSKPGGDVLLDVTSSRTTEGLVSPATLAFTEVNWNAPQTVTVTGVDDRVADGMQTYVVHVTPNAASVDLAYAMLNEVDVNLSNTDDDSAGITVVAGQALTTTEGGGTASFTIALNSQPTSDVSIALSSNDTSEGTVGPTTLTFTHDNYAAPQTVTIKGVNDDMQDGNQPYRILTAPAVSNDAGYSGMDATNVELTNIDDDSAGVTVSAPNQPLMTSENLTSATFTVVLNSQPAAEVNIPVASSNTAEGTVSPGNLKFTLDNWRAPQTVTVKGVEDDGTADGSQQYQVWLLQAATTDPNYNINPPNVNVLNVDNDSPGITLRNTANLTTKEDGAMANFLIVLNSKPTADVNIALSSSRPAEGSVTPASVKFTGANWNAPQAVTITGVDDKVADGNQTYRVVTAAAVSADPKYNAVDPADPQVTNVDNDSPGISVDYKPMTGLSTKEDGSSATFTIALNSQPTADVVVPVHSSDTSEGTVSPASWTFTSANWNAPHTFTITGVDDSVADAGQPYSIVVDPATSADAKYNKLDGADVPVSNVDNDSAGITVSVADQPPLTTSEPHNTNSFTIALNSQPTADVTIAISSNDTSEGTVGPASLLFTSVNWAAPQKVTITSVDDKLADGRQPYVIEIAPAVSKDGGYSGLDAKDVDVNNDDDDSADISVVLTNPTPDNKLKTSEAGGTAKFSIVLKSQPTADVTVPVSSGNTAEGTVNKSFALFTPVNWGSAQEFTVKGVDDDSSADGDQPYSIVIGAAMSADKDYDKMDRADVSVINVDNDSAGVTVDETKGTTYETKGPTGPAFTFNVVLTSKPSADVTIPVSSSNTDEGTVSPANLKFTSTDWNSPHPVTVTGVNDDVADGDQVYAVQIGAATSADPGYSGFDYPTDLSMKNTDDDSAGIHVEHPPVAEAFTTEDGATKSFDVVLLSKPTADVVIPVSSSDLTEATVVPATLKFTTGNWNIPQSVTAKGEDDHVVDGDPGYTIFLGKPTTTDAAYAAIDPDDVDLVNRDNDNASIDVTPPPPLMSSTSETAGSDPVTIDVVLTSAPKSPVTIPFMSSNEAEGIISDPASGELVFDKSNWNIVQTVTIMGADDAVVDGDQPYVIQLGPSMSADLDYDNKTFNDIPLTNVDDDVP